jgi:hypothetical protein
VHSASNDRRILRASDAERDEVVGKLRHHGAVGRLSVDELRERIEAALEAKTLGELDALLVDLPEDPAAAAMSVAAQPSSFRAWRSPQILASAARLVVLNLVCFGLWATSGGRGLWPVLVLLFSIFALTRKASRAAQREARRACRQRTPPPFLDR